jgi:hypothetical protein
MRKILYITIPVLASLAACSPKVIYTNNPPPQYPPPQQDAPQPQPPVYADQYQADQPQTNQVFYDELSPYGNWIDYPDEGYVWQPNVGPDFRPYDTNGSWAYTDYGWTWASNYSWGWAPFHYGRWFYDDNYGWLWEPGQEWAPAWVTWGQSGDYYGWAPIPPRTEPNAGWQPRNEDWNYVQAAHITNVNVNRYVVRNNVTVINNTTIINNVTTNNVTNNYTTNNVTNNTVNNHSTVVYNRGPKIEQVENITNTHINKVTINQSTRPGESLTNNQLSIYRPVIKPAPVQSSAKPAPKQVVTYNNSSNGTSPARQNSIPKTGGQYQGRPPLRQSAPVNQNQTTTQPNGEQGREGYKGNVPANNPNNETRNGGQSINNPNQQKPAVQKTVPAANPNPATRGTNPANNGQVQQKPPVQKPVKPPGERPATPPVQQTPGPGNKQGTNQSPNGQQLPNNPNKNGKRDTSKKHKQPLPPQPQQN